MNSTTTRLLTVVAGLLWVATANAQVKISSSEKWWTYLADYDGAPGSTRVDMGQYQVAPLKTLPQLVIFGVSYKTDLANGLPDQKELDRLNDLSNPLIEAVVGSNASLYVGTFTHKNEQAHYVYVRSVVGVEEAFQAALRKACPSCVPTFRTKSDPKWDTYLKFLYPNKATMDFYNFDPRQSRTYRQ